MDRMFDNRMIEILTLFSPVLGRSLYSKRPKSERSDFGQDRFGLVAKQFGFGCCLKTEQNCSVFQTQNWFQTSFVRLPDVWDKLNDLNPNNFSFGLPNVSFSDVHCSLDF